MSLTIDTREFDAAMKLYMPHTQRDAAEVLNQKAYSIALAASALTHKADKEKMFLEIGPTATQAIGQKVRFLKRGGVKRGKVITQKVFAGNRLALIFKSKHGRWPNQTELETFWNRRVAAINFLRFGWLASIAGMAGAIGVKARKPSAKAFEKSGLKSRGGAKPARPGWRPESEFWNTSAAKGNQNTSIEGYAAEGLSKAIAQEIQRMGEHVARKMQATANKYSATLVRF